MLIKVQISLVFSIIALSTYSLITRNVDYSSYTLFLSFPARRLPLQACEGREPNGKGEMNGGWHKP
ncbi:hypothetical protein, partial [Peribacillus butanolivorans]